jgi:hypothetical protein
LIHRDEPALELERIDQRRNGLPPTSQVEIDEVSDVLLRAERAAAHERDPGA